jgi:hypothetical protein
MTKRIVKIEHDKLLNEKNEKENKFEKVKNKFSIPLLISSQILIFVLFLIFTILALVNTLPTHLAYEMNQDLMKDFKSYTDYVDQSNLAWDLTERLTNYFFNMKTGKPSKYESNTQITPFKISFYKTNKIPCKGPLEGKNSSQLCYQEIFDSSVVNLFSLDYGQYIPNGKCNCILIFRFKSNN